MSTKLQYPKHHEQDDAFPENTSGKVRIYSMQFCPYAERTRLLLQRKNVDYEVININLKSKPQWFLDRYNIGTVPVLEIGDKIIPESLISAEYVDEVFSPEDKLVSNDPYERAQHKLWLTEYGRVLTNFYKTAFYGDDKVKSREDYLNGLETFEKRLKNKLYFAGDKLGYIDYMLWPWFERTGAWVEALPGSRLPNITSWLTRMRTDPTIQKIETPNEYLKQFKEEEVNKTKKYDNLF